MSHMRPIILISITTCYLLIPLISCADDEDLKTDSSISYNFGSDTDDNTNQQVQLNIELPGFQQLAAGYSKSSSDTSILNTSQQFISIATSPYETVSIGTEYSFWGKENSLETRSFKSDIVVNYDSWSISLSPQLNIVSFFGENGDNKFDLYSQAASISVNYFGFDNYFIGANYYSNRFADDPFFFTNQTQKNTVLSLVSESAQLLMSSLEKYHSGLSVGRLFHWGSHWGSAEISWSESKTSFNPVKIHTTSLFTSLELSKRFNLNLSVTRQSSSIDSDPLFSFDTGIEIHW